MSTVYECCTRGKDVGKSLIVAHYADTEEEAIKWLATNGGGVYRNTLHNFQMEVHPGVNHFGIDVATSGKAMLISALKKLKSTHEVEDGGMYHQDNGYSQVHISTIWTEEELDTWLYKKRFPRYVYIVGIFVRIPDEI